MEIQSRPATGGGGLHELGTQTAGCYTTSNRALYNGKCLRVGMTPQTQLDGSVITERRAYALVVEVQTGQNT